jgi:hypothetical protein
MKQRADGASSAFGSCITTALPLPKKPTTVSRLRPLRERSSTVAPLGRCQLASIFPLKKRRPRPKVSNGALGGIVTGKKENSTLSASNETLLPGSFLERTEFLQFQFVGGNREEARGAATPKESQRAEFSEEMELWALSFLQGQSKLWRAIEELASSRPNRYCRARKMNCD